MCVCVHNNVCKHKHIPVQVLRDCVHDCIYIDIDDMYRVRLRCESLPHSDYINASFVNVRSTLTCTANYPLPYNYPVRVTNRKVPT